MFNNSALRGQVLNKCNNLEQIKQKVVKVLLNNFKNLHPNNNKHKKKVGYRNKQHKAKKKKRHNKIRRQSH